MIKKVLATLFLIAYFFSSNASVKDTLPAFIGISYVPSLNWKVGFINHKVLKEPLSLKFNLTSMTTYEGNFGIRQIGLRMGISAQTENNLIGKAYRWGGYLGFRGFILKLQKSKISGTLTWNQNVDPVVFPGFIKSQNFSNEYFNVDLIKVAKKKRYIDGKWVVTPAESQIGFYWGIGYTSLAYPVELSTLVTEGGRENQVFGKPAYDPKYSVKSYNIGFGFDILRQLCLTGGRYGMTPGKPAMPFGVYFITQDKVGFGPGTITNYGVDMAEALNPGRIVVADKFFNVMVHYTLSLGVRYYFRTGPAAYIFAGGSDFEGAAMIPFGGAADTNKDLGFDFTGAFFNHGVSFKLFVTFNRDWK